MTRFSEMTQRSRWAWIWSPDVKTTHSI